MRIMLAKPVIYNRIRKNSEENEDTDESKEVSDVFMTESLYCGYGRLHLQDCSGAAMPH
jgi:hypothetical protein